jgi:hypothetical protein
LTLNRLLLRLIACSLQQWGNMMPVLPISLGDEVVYLMVMEGSYLANAS